MTTIEASYQSPMGKVIEQHFVWFCKLSNKILRLCLGINFNVAEKPAFFLQNQVSLFNRTKQFHFGIFI